MTEKQPHPRKNNSDKQIRYGDPNSKCPRFQCHLNRPISRRTSVVTCNCIHAPLRLDTEPELEHSPVLAHGDWHSGARHSQYSPTSSESRCPLRVGGYCYSPQINRTTESDYRSHPYGLDLSCPSPDAFRHQT